MCTKKTKTTLSIMVKSGLSVFQFEINEGTLEKLKLI
jgi:hypothetical protein